MGIAAASLFGAFSAAQAATCPTANVGTTLTPYVTPVPYSVRVKNQMVSINTGGKPRAFDFGGDTPFVGTATGVANPVTMQSGYVYPGFSQETISSSQINNSGLPNRVYKVPGGTVTAYRSGDKAYGSDPVLRTQLNSYAVPADKRMVWDLCFTVGQPAAGKPWPKYPNGQRPVLLWQVKSSNTAPSMALDVDTDPYSPNYLQLRVITRAGTTSTATAIGKIGGLSQGQPIHVVVDAVLDERDVTVNGRGLLKVSVNGKQIVNRRQRTLYYGATTPHLWAMGVYNFNAHSPEYVDRVVTWHRARMLQAN